MKRTDVLIVIFVVATVAFAGAFGYAFASYSSEKNQNNNLTATYDNQQGAVVLKSAFSHWNDIAIENLSLLASQYEPNATLTWIGGPLSGTYTGNSSILAVWEKFFNLWSAVWFYAESPPTVSVSGNSAVVSSQNQFVLTPFSDQQQVQYLNISYALRYTMSSGNWLISSETWHITGSGYISYTGSEVGALMEQASLQAAFTHWNDIAIENLSLLASQYEPNATLTWIGGPLSGTYTGNSSILAVWEKFFNLWSAVWFYAESPPTVSVSGNSATVTSANQFIVTPFSEPYQVQYINVSYTLIFVFQNNSYKISSEVWHITGTGFISLSQESYEYSQISNLAFTHWNDIAIENTSLVMQEYASNATLHWTNGPLKGNYTGTSEINATWSRFFAMWSAVWFYSESPPVIMISGSMATVESTIQFVVQNSSNLSQFDYINVTYTIQYYDLGFNSSSGVLNFAIVNEIFDNTEIGPLSKV
ncbi:MAG: hypothetical protein M1605_05310 [Candidatus Thermoplasmatota archaeon]|nr:hypothetical protein [Candidatus Thermoplasmatota archaeon]